ncbi:HAD family hydrolase [Streptomyces sp. KLOTTS4A1]|uniref:HAD family hydrolase n=1 Tax=Streptomyces sp. KLOTTS4A1 TaxID=3390996 RepID=UPI0039F5C3ED
MNEQLPFDAVLCDFDGVVHLWDPDGMSALDRSWGLAEGTLARAAFRTELLDAAVTGRLTDEQWREQVAADLAGACGGKEQAQALVGAWSAQTGRVDAEVMELLAAVRRVVPVVLVSNATTRLEATLASHGLSDAFDSVVNTARVGAAKPDPRVFAEAARRARAEPNRCLFVDDTAGHVTAAREAGLTGLHYQHPGQLQEAVTGLLPSAPRAPRPA